MKTNPELCAAVARVMGKTSVIDRRVCSIRLHHDDPRSNVFGHTVVWAPDRPGKDFCEVLTWAVNEGHDPEFWGDTDGDEDCYVCRIYGRGDYAGTSFDTIEQALCRAVASMSDE